MFVAIELKASNGKTSALQDYNLEKIASCGGLAMVITPQNEEESLLFLEKIARESSKCLIKNSVYQ